MLVIFYRIVILPLEMRQIDAVAEKGIDEGRERIEQSFQEPFFSYNHDPPSS